MFRVFLTYARSWPQNWLNLMIQSIESWIQSNDSRVDYSTQARLSANKKNLFEDQSISKDELINKQ